VGVVRSQVRRGRSWTVVGLAVMGALVSGACRRSATVVVVPVVDAGREWVIWDLNPAVGRERCEIHGTRLTTVVVPIQYGHAPPEIFDRGFLAAEGEQFPYAADSEEGGCFPLGYTHARVKHCSKCADAKQRWLSEHPDVAGSGRPRLTGR
jgi:hypothetical protein